MYIVKVRPNNHKFEMRLDVEIMSNSLDDENEVSSYMLILEEKRIFEYKTLIYETNDLNEVKKILNQFGDLTQKYYVEILDKNGIMQGKTKLYPNMIEALEAAKKLEEEINKFKLE